MLRSSSLLFSNSLYIIDKALKIKLLHNTAYTTEGVHLKTHASKNKAVVNNSAFTNYSTAFQTILQARMQLLKKGVRILRKF